MVSLPKCIQETALFVINFPGSLNFYQNIKLAKIEEEALFSLTFPSLLGKVSMSLRTSMVLIPALTPATRDQLARTSSACATESHVFGFF